MAACAAPHLASLQRHAKARLSPSWECVSDVWLVGYNEGSLRCPRSQHNGVNKVAAKVVRCDRHQLSRRLNEG